ncbi:hypothetical protein JCM10213_007275 [Rhodosporidiobolus nylandii]
MLTAHGFTVQLFLQGVPLPATTQITLNKGATAASFAGPLAAGVTWLVAWRDNRGLERTPTVGSVFVSQGDGTDALVGSCPAQEGDQKYFVLQGELDSSRSPFKLTLVIKSGSLVARNPTPLAVFTLTVNNTQRAQATQPLSPPIASSPVEETFPRKYVAGPMLQLRSDDYLELTRRLEESLESSKHFQESVHALYSALPLPQLIAYLDRRLRHEALSPSMRCSIALSKRSAEERLRAESEEATRMELQGLIEELLKVQPASKAVKMEEP